MKHDGFTLWFTGLSGSGKTTLAVALEKKLLERKIPYVQRLDGDIIREGLSKDLGFSKEDRDENIRRVTFIAELLSKNGVATLVSFISPYRQGRSRARERCHNFVEVYVRCDLDTLVKRDIKGLYRKALNGEISDFTGISDPYEEPENPDILVDSSIENVDQSLNRIISWLEEKSFV